MVRRSNGAPGIDKITLAAVEEYGITRFLDELAAELREGRYRPAPARRVYIPKPGAPAGEQRPLSIPSVRDRIVQAAAKIVLEPVFEADFLPASFGLRPRRSAHDALQVLIDESWRGRRWVVETDIASCFSAIPHERLMEAVEERICDQPPAATGWPGLRTPSAPRSRRPWSSAASSITPTCRLCGPRGRSRRWRPDRRRKGRHNPVLLITRRGLIMEDPSRCGKYATGVRMTLGTGVIGMIGSVFADPGR